MKKLSVLIIDDNEVDRYLLVRDLKKTGIQVTTFELKDGEEALTFFKSHKKNRDAYPDDYPPMIVFLDINMPRVDGFEFLSEFSDLRKEIDVDPCIFMMFSSSEREQDREKAFSYDFVKDYLVKGSFSSDELKEKVEAFAIDL